VGGAAVGALVGADEQVEQTGMVLVTTGIPPLATVKPELWNVEPGRSWGPKLKRLLVVRL